VILGNVFAIHPPVLFAFLFVQVNQLHESKEQQKTSQVQHVVHAAS
jgi:hypothetical protein